MVQRAAFLAIAVFWVTMNVLLWRSEFGGGTGTGSEIPVVSVVDRILTAPDPSTLRVRHRGVDLGLLRWMPTVLEDPNRDLSPETEGAPEGLVQRVLGYQIECDFHFQAEDESDRWRFFGQAELGTNRWWRTLNLRFIQRPSEWDLVADRDAGTVRVRQSEGREVRTEQTYRAADLAALPALLGAYGNLLPKGLITPDSQWDPSRLSLGIQWTARHDRLRIGRHWVRVYRIDARLFKGYEATLYVSRAGELLRADLPDGLTLRNDGVPGLR